MWNRMLIARHDTVDLLPRLELADLRIAQDLRGGDVVTIAFAAGAGAALLPVTVERIQLGAYHARDARGRPLTFHAKHVLRVIRRSA